MGNLTDEPVQAPATLDFYRCMFEGIDVFMSFWQPMLKGVGRMNLEIAQVSAQHARSTLIWTSDMVRSRAPSDVLSANLKLYEALRTQQRDSIEKITAAISKAVETPPGFEIPKVPQSPARDILILPGRDAKPARSLPVSAAAPRKKPQAKTLVVGRKNSRRRVAFGSNAPKTIRRASAQTLPRPT